MSEEQGLYLFTGKKVLVDGRPGAVEHIYPSGVIRVRLDDGLVWIGLIDHLSAPENDLEPIVID